MPNRIVSLVPSATEMIAELVDSPDQLVGVTHECDFPYWVSELPKVIGPADPAILRMDPADVDRAVVASRHEGRSLYRLDVDLLRALRPDLVVTQSLCDVCAIGPGELRQALAQLPAMPQVLELSPMTLDDVLGDVLRVGEALGTSLRAGQWRAELEDRLEKVGRESVLRGSGRVLALEWVDPLWVAGHWVPEMIRWAGGEAVFASAGRASMRADWEDCLAAEPDFVIVMCCGYGLKQNVAMVERLATRPGWSEIPAVRAGRVYAVDANSLFSRPSPRLVDGVELLADVFRDRPLIEGVGEWSGLLAPIGEPVADGAGVGSVGLLADPFA